MRKKNSVFNMISSLSSYIISTIFTFITQACIVKILGIEYSGVNGLFTNILTMLSVAELGIGTTIIYKLYKPLAEDDKESIKSWLNFYKTCYRLVTIFIIIFGLVLVPFLSVIVGEVQIQDNLILLYIICLMDTILSYCMTYKRSLLYANQKNYIINFVHIFYTLFMNITQVILLFLTESYVIFLIVKLIYRLLENIIINIYVDRKYSYLKDKSQAITKEEKRDVLGRIKAIFLQKVSFVINKGIDNIVISYFLGVVSVGYYTNYNLIVTAIDSVIYQFMSGITASVGNLLTEKDCNKNYQIYKRINMINSFLTGTCVICFTCAITPFIVLWVGKNYLLSTGVVLAFSLYIYTDSIRRSITIFKDAAGICKEDKMMYVIMAFINLVVSILLCKIIGISGVILGTAISYLFLIIYSYPKYIFKPVFNKNYIDYYKENFKYFMFICVSLFISYIICSNININNYFIQLLINIIVALICVVSMFMLFFRKTAEYKYYLSIIKKIITKIKERFYEKNINLRNV